MLYATNDKRYTRRQKITKCSKSFANDHSPGSRTYANNAKHTQHSHVSRIYGFFVINVWIDALILSIFN